MKSEKGKIPVKPVKLRLHKIFTKKLALAS